VPGKPKATFTKHFKQGLLSCPLCAVADAGIVLEGVTRDNVKSIRVNCSAQGRTDGQGTQVERIFPYVDNWSGVVAFYITDPVLDQTIQTDEGEEVHIVEEHLRKAGLLNGVGRWRPQTGGNNGRFTVDAVTFQSC
jgi:hypothetical protein